MTDHSEDSFQIAVLSSMLLFFSACAWLLPFAAIDEAATFEFLSLTGDTWYVSLGLLFWFAFGSYRVTMAEAQCDDSKVTTNGYYMKLLLVPFAPLLMVGRQVGNQTMSTSFASCQTGWISGTHIRCEAAISSTDMASRSCW